MDTFPNTPSANLAGPIGNGLAIVFMAVKIASHPGIRTLPVHAPHSVL